MEMLFQLKTGARNVILLFALRFLWQTEAMTIYPEYCFNRKTESTNPLQHFKNESWRTASMTELLQQMLQCYDERVRPEQGAREAVSMNPPTVVTVQLYILSIGNFQVRDMDFALSFYFRQQWWDPRLAYGDRFHEENITLGGEILEQLWLPDTHIINKKGSRSDTGKNFLVRINRKGNVLLSTKNTLTMDCFMDLRNFPFDDQKCNLTLESFGFTSKDVVYKWMSPQNTESVQQDPGLTTSEFVIGPTKIFESITQYETGPFSGLKMELNFQRRTVFYLIQIYIPSGMIVVLSWIAFWIDNQSIPARTALGITTVLAMTTLLFGVQSSLPSVPYIKAVDLFMIVSFANVFAALVEFAVVNYTSSREKERESRPRKNTYTVNPDIVTLSFRNISFRQDSSEDNNNLQNGDLDYYNTANKNSLDHDKPISNGTNNLHVARDQPCPSCDSPHVQEPRYGRSSTCCWRCKITANAIDAWSRILFPISYGVFIVAYWILYSKSEDTER